MGGIEVPIYKEKDVGIISELQWNRILELAPLVSLSHLYLLYRTYYTPPRLFQFGHRPDARCPRCGDSEGDIIHIFWRCPKLFRYRTVVTRTIDRVFGTPTRW